ncbi:TetR/AcrR family transcriptional regulator [Nocardioides coralli]|uniref:TetR/AcrR family transcriptional regulator n=1 Tax=Nocardioides coralli TaxID=2872154 RepID=UPI001CA43A93|nr:TetR/AcrR family transcriptional regulator [Nocardioides coralli]QZY28751.1 TetR/AcrR family transcriptional regulator [Nocardioides coralli]
MGRREEQAAQTRREIVAAARRLFATQGYARTSVTQVAAEAGVSVQTIYDAVGSKAALAAALNELIDEEAGIGELARTIGTLEDPRALVALPVQITRQLMERCGDLVRATFGAASSEPQLAEVAAVGRQRHRAGVDGIAGRLAGLDALAVPAPQAAATMAVLTDSRVALTCLDDYGWSLTEWDRWTRAALERLLLA